MKSEYYEDVEQRWIHYSAFRSARRSYAASALWLWYAAS